MKKIAIFVEGLGEAIFTRRLIEEIAEPQGLKIEYQFLGKGQNLTQVRTFRDSPDPILYFQIINASSDSRVLSAILNREKDLFSNGFSMIIGLRDMYSHNYEKFSKTKQVSQALNQKFIDGANEQLKHASQPDKIHYCFSIMEMEAWLLGFGDFLERVDPQMDSIFIHAHLKVHLAEIDPEKTFFKPSSTLKKLLSFVDLEYDKKEGTYEKLFSHLSWEDFENAMKNPNRLESFKSFYALIYNQL